MVNHTATWLKPGGRLTTEQIADGYCDMLFGSDPPGTSRRRARAARAGPRDVVDAPSPAPPPPADRPFELDGVLVAELADGIAGYVKLGPALPTRPARTSWRSRASASTPTTGGAASPRR